MSKTGSGKAAPFPRDIPDSSQSDSSDGLLVQIADLQLQTYALRGLCHALLLVIEELGEAVEGIDNHLAVNAADATARTIADRLVEHQAALERLETGRFDNWGAGKEGGAA